MDQAEQLRNVTKVNNVTTPLARIIAVTSGKGGVGKSNVAINLAIQFRKMGKKVIILDADFGLANIEIMFGLMPKYNLSNLLRQEKTISDIITWGPMNVGFISGGSGISEMTDMNHDELNYIIKNLAELDTMTDIIIIDTGAGISHVVLEFLLAGGEVILVTTPEPTSITDSYSLLKSLTKHPSFSKNDMQIKVLGNRTKREEEGVTLFETLNMVASSYLKLPIEYLGTIPQDSQISNAIMQQTPVTIVNSQAKSSLAFEAIAYKLMNEEIPAHMKKKGMATFFSKIIKENQR